jgi:hypothetical protein
MYRPEFAKHDAKKGYAVGSSNSSKHEELFSLSQAFDIMKISSYKINTSKYVHTWKTELCNERTFTKFQKVSKGII